MNQFNRAILPTLLTTIVGIGLLTTPAHAQDTTGGGATAGGTTGGGTTTTNDDQPNYGWIGLLGLAGLAGLLKKPHTVHEVRHDNVSPGTR